MEERAESCRSPPETDGAKDESPHNTTMGNVPNFLPGFLFFFVGNC
jgi:hypothetical protein